MHGTRWLVVVSIVCLCLLAGSTGEVASLFTDSETSAGSTLQGWTSRLWTQTTLAQFENGTVPAQADTRSSPGDVGLARGSGVFAFQGGMTSAFWRFGVTDNAWAAAATPPAPNAVGPGGALAYNGTQYIYAVRGGNQTTFWRYDTAAGTWATLAPATAVNDGGALALAGANRVYALLGNGTGFRRYRAALGTWQNRRGTPAAVGPGAALAYDGTAIYALQGGGLTGFWRHNIIANTWTTRTAAPGAVGAGGALASVGTSIYALQGGGLTGFWRYDIAGNSWTAMAAAPAVGAGGALAYDGSGYIYAFQGGTGTGFWRYDILNNSWTAMAAAPGAVGAGGALAFVRGTAYVAAATVASQVLDTGVPGDAWDALTWDETLPAGTSISFEVRASDAWFSKDDALLPWTAVGPSPVTSGLPAGRYKQWRITLTTTDTAVTPLLHEVRLYYR